MSNQDRKKHASRDSHNLYTAYAFIIGVATGIATRMTEGKTKPQRSTRNHRKCPAEIAGTMPAETRGNY